METTDRDGVSPDRGAGVMLGLACGDALGEPVEGWSADRIAAEYGTLDSFVDGRVPPGGLTDDTEQALRLARSLIACDGFDPDDAADRFRAWYEGGAVGIGGLTRRVLQRIARGQDWESASRQAWEGSPEGRNAGNGSVMRCAPLAVAYATSGDLAAVSRTSSRLTHWDPRCVAGCELLNRTIAGCLTGGDAPADALATLDDALTALGDAPEELVGTLRPVADGEDVDLRPTGYVLDTLQAALRIGLTAGDAPSGIVTAVNAGGDTDTVGAVTGAIVGARFGAGALPERWLTALDAEEELRRVGRRLATLDP